MKINNKIQVKYIFMYYNYIIIKYYIYPKKSFLNFN